MAIGAPWVGNAGGGSALTSFQLDFTNATVGEWMFAGICLSDSQASVPTPPAGWTEDTNAQIAEGTTGAASSRTIVWRRQKQAGDTTVTFSWPTSCTASLLPWSWPGLDPTTPVESVVGLAHSSTTAYATGTVTPTSTDRWIGALFHSRSSTSPGGSPWTPDAAMTEDADFQSGSNPWDAVELADTAAAVTQAGHTYTATANVTASHGGVIAFALIPAPTVASTDSGAFPSQPPFMLGQLTNMPAVMLMAPPWNAPPISLRTWGWGDDVFGPFAYTQTLTGGLTFTGANNTKVSKLLGAAAAAFTGALNTLTSKLLTLATLAFTGALTTKHVFAKALTAVLSFTGAQSRAVGTHLAAGLTFIGALPRLVGSLRTAQISFTGALPRRVATALIGAGLSFTGALNLRTARTLTATVSFTGSLATAAVHFFTKALSATVGFTGSLTRLTSRPLTAGVSFTGLLSRAIARGQAATLNFSGTQARRVTSAQSATVSFVGAQTRRTSRAFTASVSFTGSLATQVAHFFTKSLTAALSFTGSLSTSHLITRAFIATVGFTGTQTRRAGKALAATVTFTGAQSRGVSTHLVAALTLTATFTKIPTLLSALSSLRTRISGREPRSSVRYKRNDGGISGREDGT